MTVLKNSLLFKNLSIRTIISEIPDYLLLILYVYTAGHKIIAPQEFRDSLLKSPLIPLDKLDWVFYGVPIVELLIVVLLLIKKTNIFAHYLSIFLLVVFCLYIYILNNHSIYNGCGCGGIFSQFSLGTHLLINSVFVIISSLKVIFDVQTIKNDM